MAKVGDRVANSRAGSQGVKRLALTFALAALVSGCGGSAQQSHSLSTKDYEELLIGFDGFAQVVKALNKAHDSTVAILSAGSDVQATVSAIRDAKRAWSDADYKLIVFTPGLQRIVPSLPSAIEAVRSANQAWQTALDEMELRATEGAISDASLRRRLDEATSSEAAAADAINKSRNEAKRLYCKDPASRSDPTCLG